MRAVLVVIHASAGVAGLAAGLAALSPPRSGDGRGWLRGAYLGCVGLLLVSLVALVALDWAELDAASRVTFAALTGLGAVIAFRLGRAWREAARRPDGWRQRYVRHIYFTYISLWEGFVILPALNLPLPQATVPVVAVTVLLVGHVLIRRYERRLFGAAGNRPTKRLPAATRS